MTASITNTPANFELLSKDDVNRLPDKSAMSNMQIPAMNETQQDSFQLGPNGYQVPPEQESHPIRKTIWTIILVGLASIALKHCGFMKIADRNNMKLLDYLKLPVITIGNIAEKPFKWIFKRKASDTKNKPSDVSNTPKIKGILTKIKNFLGALITFKWLKIKKK